MVLNRSYDQFFVSFRQLPSQSDQPLRFEQLPQVFQGLPYSVGCLEEDDQAGMLNGRGKPGFSVLSPTWRKSQEGELTGGEAQRRHGRDDRARPGNASTRMPAARAAATSV